MNKDNDTYKQFLYKHLLRDTPISETTWGDIKVLGEVFDDLPEDLDWSYLQSIYYSERGEIRESKSFSIRMRVNPVFFDAIREEMELLRTKYENASSDNLETCEKCKQKRICEHYFEEEGVFYPVCSICKVDLERWQSRIVLPKS